MLDQLKMTIDRACELRKDQPILVGLSGGPDSLCLADALSHLGYPLVAAHLNHSLRPEADAEALFVQHFARSRSIPVVMGKEDVRRYSEAHSLSIEEAARNLRYRFLFDQAAAHHAQAVAVGHTADDQVETLLMHLLRGSGISGLKGMAFRALPNPWSETIPLIRPLLAAWRREIMAYIEARGLKPVFDPSNLDTRLFRNRLRHQLIPSLEEYNPAVREVLWKTADILREDFAVLGQAIDEAWQSCVLEVGEGYVVFEPQSLRKQPLGLQRHLLRRGIEHLRPGLRDIGFETIEKGLSFLAAPSQSGQIDLAAGLRMLFERERLWLAGWEADLPAADWPQLPPEMDIPLPIPGEVTLENGWALRVEEVPGLSAAQVEHVRDQARTEADPFHAWAPAGRLETLRLRTRRPGDRFQPLGMEGHSVKLSDFMTNEKLPRRARRGWPLVLSDGEIAWIPGMRLAHSFRITGGAQALVHLWLVKEK